MRKTACVCSATGCLCAGVASASVATFDTLTEGNLGLTFVDGGITFFDLDDRTGAGFVPFSCERADDTLSGFPGFSPPNTLGFGSWVPGSGAAFQQCGSFKFSAGGVQTSASLDVFEWLSPAGNTISLEAYLNGTLVNSDSVVIPGNGLLNHWNLSVAGAPFDTLRLNGSGPGSLGTFIGLVDNVVVVPAPASAMGLGLLVLGAVRRRR